MWSTFHFYLHQHLFNSSREFPGGPVAKMPQSQCRGAQLRSLVRDLDPKCNSGSHVLQLRPGAANKLKNKLKIVLYYSVCVKWKFFQIEKNINLSVNCRPALPLATSLSTESQEHRENISMLLIQDIVFVEIIKACLKWREPFTQNTANKSLVNLLTHFSQSKWYHEMITVSHNNNIHYLNSYKIFFPCDEKL